MNISNGSLWFSKTEMKAALACRGTRISGAEPHADGGLGHPV
jgi:hypothetical protein